MATYLLKKPAASYTMSMNEFLILGCGHSESIEHHNNNAALISNGGNLLIDCGHTIKYALLDQKMTFADVDAIYITHVHGDHVFGLERIAYEAKFKYHKRIKLFFHKSIFKELWEQTLKGSLGYNSDGETTLDDYFDVQQIDTDHFYFDGHKLQLVKVSHTPNKPTYGVLINDYLFYSTDTIAIPDIIKKLNFEVGFHDVTFSPNNPVHASLDSMIEIYPKDIRKKLYLMSYEDEWRDYEAIVKQEFNGLAKQGMRITL